MMQSRKILSKIGSKLGSHSSSHLSKNQCWIQNRILHGIISLDVPNITADSGGPWCTPHRSYSKSTGRQKLVILGSGWGSYSVLKTINKNKYDVVVVSPRNHFLFTPLLCSTTVGTLEFR